MNILSVDWDYFYPDNLWFDWQMDEKKSIYYEMIWPIRYGNHHLKTNELAKDVYKVDHSLLNQFWSKVLRDSDPIKLVMSDTHIDIGVIFKLFKNKVSIWNFDQHHDAGYHKKEPTELNCGNWVKWYWEQIKEYHLIYPPWRKNHPENKPTIDFPIHYSIPKQLPEFDVVFICRSSPWTPSWDDPIWIEFIEHFKQHKILWERKLSALYVLKPRPFDKKGAEELLERTNQLIEDAKKGVKTL